MDNRAATEDVAGRQVGVQVGDNATLTVRATAIALSNMDA